MLAGSHEVAGSQIGFPSPSTVGTFSKTLAVRTTGGQKELVHFWNGEKNIEGKVGLLFGSNEAALVGQTEVTASQQEIGIFEN